MDELILPHGSEYPWRVQRIALAEAQRQQYEVDAGYYVQCGESRVYCCFKWEDSRQGYQCRYQARRGRLDLLKQWAIDNNEYENFSSNFLIALS